MQINRRRVLQFGGAASLIGFANPLPLFARGTGNKKLVFVFLRGAMDGLAVFPAYGDPEFERARAGIAMPPPGAAGGVNDLDGFFGIHPEIPFLKSLFDEGDMAVVHAIASPYRARSHFDAQNLVENGTTEPFGRKTGWLNKVVSGAPQVRGGMSLTTSTPVIFRGDADVTTWSPSRLPQPDQAFIDRLGRLYGSHPDLTDSFQKAMISNKESIAASDGSSAFPSLMRSAARFMHSETGPQVSFLELGGWDSHAGQMGRFGPLIKNLRSVDAGVKAFKEEIGSGWNETVVLFVTEFGRTVAMNGSKGTDHGTGGAAFIAGGAVAGGKVYADWPGLSAANLYEGRDLMPTADLRSLFKGVLHGHLGVDRAHLDSVVFPDSGGIPAMTSLLRA